MSIADVILVLAVINTAFLALLVLAMINGEEEEE